MEVQLQSFLFSALHEGKWSAKHLQANARSVITVVYIKFTID